MSRSRKHNPFTGITKAKSEKEDKRFHNRRLRKRVSETIRREDPENLVLPNEQEVSEVYSWNKDGKFRFDPSRFPEYMRK